MPLRERRAIFQSYASSVSARILECVYWIKKKCHKGTSCNGSALRHTESFKPKNPVSESSSFDPMVLRSGWQGFVWMTIAYPLKSNA